jgi:hypothetical protein
MSRHINRRRLTSIPVLTNEHIEFNLIMRIVTLYLPDIPRASTSKQLDARERVVPWLVRRYLSDSDDSTLPDRLPVTTSSISSTLPEDCVAHLDRQADRGNDQRRLLLYG